ncbi:MAG: 2Fe-2S iron-sulfur cluster binding domain-containing protein [Gammaproteobacteria bacterium]|nr:2Fe-2S iron-sulfur cluster binding domain-containing protein [Gammaproteobacteria bacterium]
MHQFYPAKIIDKQAEADDAIRLTLAVDDGNVNEFRYVQGQHLPVRAFIGKDEIRRTYSICTSACEQQLCLGIRIQPGGQFSDRLLGQLETGQTLEVMPPAGHFFTELDPAQSRTYAAFVAGSGITPILSIVSTTLEVEPQSRFFVFYGNRRKATTMFIEELNALKNRYPGRLSLHFIMSREESEIELYHGRIDGARTRALHDAFLAHNRPNDVFICGPNEMIDQARATLLELDYDKRRIHSERFVAAGAAEDRRPEPIEQTPASGVEVGFVMDGHRQSFHMDPDAPSILDAAQDAGLDLPYSCKGGVCSTCRTLLTKGEVDMAATDALEDWEIEEGFILTCQARPKTGEIELDYDEA